MFLIFKRYLFLFLIAGSLNSVAAGDSAKYERSFPFQEGIYLNFWQFRNNDPIIGKYIVSDYNKDDKEFLLKVLSQNSITYKDGAGEEHKVKERDIWGYSVNKEVYIRTGNSFARVQIIGSISHYLGLIESYNAFSYDPYDLPVRAQGYENQQTVIDMRTGNIFPFSVTTMEELLKQDPELYNEFIKLKKKKKRSSIFIYLQKFNQKHPLYIPNH